MAYKNDELIIYCKYCKRRKKLITRSYIRPNGNFCSQTCFKNYEVLNSQSEEEKREKWNKYQREYKRNKYVKRPKNPNRLRKVLIKTLKKRVKILRKLFVCGQCGRTFINKYGYRERRYCGYECRADAERIWKDAKEQKRMHRRNGNGGIKKVAFNKMRAECGYKCAICGEKEPFDQYWPLLVQDHIIPRSKGGKKRSKENIQPLCWNCNNVKSDK